jgi:hypothetical protein
MQRATAKLSCGKCRHTWRVKSTSKRAATTRALGRHIPLGTPEQFLS